MLPVFMEIAVYRNFLFYARCGAKDFFDKLSPAAMRRGFPVPILKTSPCAALR